jgi:hypothetical protein
LFSFRALKSSLFASSDRTGESEITTFDRDLTEHQCGHNGTYAIVVHGWKESIATPWVMGTIVNLMYHRGGCVIFMDYSNYSIVSDYFQLTPHFYGIASVLLRKVKQIGNYNQLFMYGFSFGSRLCFEVGIQLGYQQIDRIDACDPAGPGFDETSKAKDPKLAAKNVACINTSTDKGTSKYNCHQNFRMGKCGKKQLSAGPKPLGNHGMCPYFYNSAFNNVFEANNYYNCTSKNPAPSSKGTIRMGYHQKLS